MAGSFIKAPMELNKVFTGLNKAPLFRKRFHLINKDKAKLYVCGLGYAYCYVNGRAVSQDLFIAPVSDYCKTLWYNTYDITHLLEEGDNVVAVWCGNGFFNEEFRSDWSYNAAKWRDVPKLWLKIEMSGEILVETDASWRAKSDSAVIFNALRSGEHFDSRLYDPSWAEISYDDADWEYAIPDDNHTGGTLRLCDCEPIREMEVLQPVSIKKTKKDRIVYDFGRVISGYVKLTASGKNGQKLQIKYAEQIKDDGSLEMNNMGAYYPESEMQTDVFICNGNSFEWSPKFCYHGFRYIEISGLESADDIVVKAAFVHQAVERKTTFSCSEPLLNQMFMAGIYSTWSNMFYQMTDCPTREKLGWTNDAQASMQQIMMDFRAEKVLKKWMQDIWDAMTEEGALPGTIPTAGWGYHWGNGPVSDGVLFELPFRIYEATGDGQLLCDALPYFKRYLNYLDKRRDADGFIRFGLPDWAKPGFDLNGPNDHVPVEFINALFLSEFYRIASIAQALNGEDNQTYLFASAKEKNRVIQQYITASGSCDISHMTAVAMLIYYDAYDHLNPLKRQLMQMLHASNYHHDCGMVGLRRLLVALDKCGLQEYAYKVLTVKGYPSFCDWFEQGATTLWETWDWHRHSDSKNHHMYSSFMTWLIETVAGIRQDPNSVGYQVVHIQPTYLQNLQFASASYQTGNGEVSVRWERDGSRIVLNISVPKKIEVLFMDKALPVGENQIVISE